MGGTFFLPLITDYTQYQIQETSYINITCWTERNDLVVKDTSNQNKWDDVARMLMMPATRVHKYPHMAATAKELIQKGNRLRVNRRKYN